MSNVTITTHFRQRVADRIGPSTDPEHLAKGLFWALDNQRKDLVAYLGRSRCKQKHLVRFRATETAQVYRAALNLRDRVAITVLPNASADDEAFAKRLGLVA